MWSYWVQRIGVYVVIALAFIFAPVIMMQIIDGDVLDLAIYVMVLAGVFFILQSVRVQWIYIVCMLTGMTVTINFLPINFSFFECAVLMVGGHFVIEHVMIRHRGIRYGNILVFGCIAVIGGILLYHWFKQGIGFQMLGGDDVGARKNFSAVLGCGAYLLIVTLGKDQWKLLNGVPWLYFIATLLFLMPYVVSTYLPSIAPYIYRFISNVNLEAYRENMSESSGLGRIGQLGTFSWGITTFLISQYPVRHWWRPERWWVAILFLVAFALCLRSGFRSAVFMLVCITAVGSYLSLGLRSFWLAIMGAILLALLSIGHGTFFELHPSIQRAMSFVPGNWDPGVLDTTASSDDFRKRIQDIYVKEFLYKSPLIGNGYNFKKMDLYALELSDGASSYRMTPYEFHKGFIMRKDFHIGWISLYDAVGVLGGIFFVLLFFINLWLLIKSLSYFPKNQPPPILVWVMVQIISSFVSFFAVFGAFQQMLPFMCVLSALTYLIYEYAKEQRMTSKTAITDAVLA